MEVSIDMNRIGWEVELWGWVGIEGLVLRQNNVPVGLADAVTCLMRLDDGKVERSVDECVAVCEINPAPEWDQTVMLSLRLGSIGWPDEMCCSIWDRSGNNACSVVLQPEALIDGVVLNVIVMKGEEFDKEATILEARRG
jgi:hypothetical protein